MSMGCCIKRGGSEKTVTLTFDREQLQYDVGNMAYVESDLMEETSGHGRHVTADVIEAGNVDRINRIFDQVHAEAQELLYPYTRRHGGRDSLLTNVQSDRNAYVIEMRVPEHFSDTTAQLLQTLIHEWFVAAALASWLGLTNDGAASKWKGRVEELRRAVDEGKNRHSGVLRRKMSTF